MKPQTTKRGLSSAVERDPSKFDVTGSIPVVRSNSQAPNILPWKTRDEAPEDKTLALILINGKITADVFVYFKTRAIFVTHSLHEEEVVENKVKLSEVDAWIGLGELPLPVWIAGRG